jgi:hypothetical protein
VVPKSQLKSIGSGRAKNPIVCFALGSERFASSSPNTMSERSYSRAKAVNVRATIARKGEDFSWCAHAASRMKSARFNLNAILASATGFSAFGILPAGFMKRPGPLVELSDPLATVRLVGIR